MTLLIALAAANAATSALTPTCADITRLPVRPQWGDVDANGRIRLDPSKPVSPREAIINAWQARQETIRSFRFEWTEVQCHPRGWIPNPRHDEREWLLIPNLRVDRSYTVRKSLAVDGNRMRYAFELDRAEEPDGVIVKSSTGDNNGLGARARYTYVSVFDGQRGITRLTTLLNVEPMPPSETISPNNVDAQNLDTRAILLTFRPLDRVMGQLQIDRAVTNQRRTFYRGRSGHLLEERHDPASWKTLVWLEPERDFIISRFAVNFAQQRIIDMDVDYRRDPRWGWIPSAWRITEMLADGTRRLISTATVTSYSINTPIAAEEFR